MKRKEGTIYLRGSTFWVKFYRAGKPFYESSHSDKITDARHLLNLRLGEKAKDEPVPIRRSVLVSELLDDVVNDYQANDRKSTEMLVQRIDLHVKPYFGHRQASQITGADIKAYVVKRQQPIPATENEPEKPGARNATINRELSALRRAFSLGLRDRKIQNVPHFEMLEENNARQGFFEDDQYQAVRALLPDHLKPIVDFANLTGWRKGEILSLEWREVDFKTGCIRLDAQKTKNNTARTIYMTARLREVMEAQRAYTDEVQSRHGLIVPRVFHHEGAEIQSFYKAWRTACNRAGVPGMLLHDFRRTHVRRLVRAGVPERVAMQQTGHRSRSVFERYNIISDSDLRDAVKKLEAAEQLQNSYTKTGTVLNRASKWLKRKGE